MTESNVIRQVQEGDHEAWLPLWRGYQAFYKVDIPAETSRLTWARLLDPAEPMFAALALRGGQAVGLVQWLFHRSTWTAGPYCYLQDLFVAPETRGAGIGRQLIDHVADQARAAQAGRLYWLTHETNEVAMQLYDKVAQRSGFLQYRKALG